MSDDALASSGRSRDNEDEEKQKNNGGFILTPTSLNCLPCRCRKNLYHKETKTTSDKDSKTIYIVENRTSYKVGRGTTPDNNIFTPDQTGSVAICDNGWGQGRTPTPEECDERIEKNADDIKELKQKLEMKIYKTEEDIKELKEDVKKLDKDVYYIIKCNEKKPDTIIETKDLTTMD